MMERFSVVRKECAALVWHLCLSLCLFCLFYRVGGVFISIICGLFSYRSGIGSAFLHYKTSLVISMFEF